MQSLSRIFATTLLLGAAGCQSNALKAVKSRVQTDLKPVATETGVVVPKPSVTVTITAPGYSASDLEQLVTQPVETELASLDELHRLSSETSEGRVTLQLEFSRGNNPLTIQRDTSERLRHVTTELPADIDPPVIQVATRGYSSEPELTFALTGDVPAATLVARLEDIQDQLETLPETTEVRGCAPRREVRISLDESSLAAYGLSVSSVSRAITNGLQTIPGSAGKPALADLRHIVLQKHAADPLELRDIATIQDTLATTGCHARVDGLSAVSASVWTKAGRQPKDAIAAKLHELENTLPQSIELRIFERSKVARITAYLPQGISPERAESLGQRVEEIAARRGSRLIEVNPEQASVQVRIASTDVSALESLRTQLDSLPDLTIGDQSLAGKPDPQVELLVISGPQLKELHHLGERLVHIVKTFDEVDSARVRHHEPRHELAITLDREHLAALGLTHDEVIETVQANRGGIEVTTLYVDGKRIPVLITVGQNSHKLDELDFLERSIVTPSGRVPLRSLITVEHRQMPPMRRRIDAQRVIEIELRRVSPTEPLSSQLRVRLTDKLDLPPGYALQWHVPESME